MREKDPAKVEAIYKAALRLVLQEGFSGLKMSDVAREAKVATGTLYIYFDSKEELINQLYLELKKRSVAQFFKDYNEQAPFMECFETIWYNYLKAGLKEPEVTAFMEQYYRSPYLRPTVIQQTDQMLEPIFKLLERGKKERLLKDVPIELMAIQLSGAISELIRWHVSGQIKVTRIVMDAAFALSWDSIKR